MIRLAVLVVVAVALILLAQKYAKPVFPEDDEPETTGSTPSTSNTTPGKSQTE